MPILAQHGYGKTEKIQRGLASQILSGAILSPRDETPENLRAFVSDMRQRFPSAEVAVDPQFYASTVIPGRLGHLPEYDFFHAELTRRSFISTELITRYVSQTLDFQRSSQVSFLISPSVLVNSFDDPWSQIALGMADQSVRWHATHKEQPLLISLVLAESALRSTRAMNEYLDILSVVKADGFYLIVQRSTPQYHQQMEPDVLKNLLYLVYSLAVVNEYRVVVGFADLIGLLLLATGASDTACGWHNSLRQFTMARFSPTRGGSPARPRYTSLPLLNSILLFPELDGARDAGVLDRVLTGTEFDQSLRTRFNADAWPLETSALHHWASLDLATSHWKRKQSVGDRLSSILDRVARARALYTILERTGVQFESWSGPTHLDQWQAAIDNFRREANV